MANTHKDSLNYHPVDIGFERKEEIRLAKEYIDPYGNDPILRFILPQIWLFVKAEIFKIGYYKKWDDSISMLFANDHGYPITMALTNRYINIFLKVGLLNQEIFNKYGILTSYEIQKTWKFVQEKQRRVNSEIDPLIHISTPKIANLREEIAIGSEEMANSSELIDIPLSFTSISNNTSNNTNSSNSRDANISNLHEEIAINSEGMANSSRRNEQLLRRNTDSLRKPSEEIAIGSEEKAISSRRNTKKAPSKKKVADKAKSDKKETPVLASTVTTNKDTQDAVSKQNALYAIENCVELYFKDPLFGKTKDMLGNSKMPIPAGATKPEVDELFYQWGLAFNRHLISHGKLHMQMSGTTNGWPNYFKNWFSGFKDKRNTDPRTLFVGSSTDDGSPVHAADKKTQDEQYTNPLNKK